MTALNTELRSKRGSLKRSLAALLVVGPLTALPSACSIFSDEPSCDDAAYYNDRAYEAGQKDLDEDSMNEYVDALSDLEAAEQDCADKGEDPQY